MGQYGEERAAQVGPETLRLVHAIFHADDVLSRLRQVQAIVTHLERHPRLRAEAAARRAVQVGDHSYQGVKRTLTLGLDLAHVLTETLVQRDAAARSAATFCASASGR